MKTPKAGSKGPATPKHPAAASSVDVAAKWELMLMRGECSLEDALMVTLHAGAHPGPYLIARLEVAFSELRAGASVAATLGTTKMGNEAQAIEAELRTRQAFELVTELHHRHPKGDPRHMSLSRASARTRKTSPTAFSAAAAMLGVSESSVVQRYEKGKALQDRSKGSE